MKKLDNDNLTEECIQKIDDTIELAEKIHQPTSEEQQIRLDKIMSEIEFLINITVDKLNNKK